MIFLEIWAYFGISVKDLNQHEIFVWIFFYFFSYFRAPVDQHKEAMNHFVAGKRHLLVKDISAAVTSLGQVSASTCLYI